MLSFYPEEVYKLLLLIVKRKIVENKISEKSERIKIPKY